MSREVAAAGTSKGTHKMGLCFVKLKNPSLAPQEQEGDRDKEPAKAG